MRIVNAEERKAAFHSSGHRSPQKPWVLRTQTCSSSNAFSLFPSLDLAKGSFGWQSLWLCFSVGTLDYLTTRWKRRSLENCSLLLSLLLKDSQWQEVPIIEEVGSQGLRGLRSEAVLQGTEPCRVYAWSGRQRRVGVEGSVLADPARDAAGGGTRTWNLDWLDWTQPRFFWMRFLAVLLADCTRC